MRRIILATFLFLIPLAPALAQKRLVLIDQDGSGPGGSNQMAMMVLLQSPQTEVLGITIVTGNAWRDEEVQHTLRMLELIGGSDVPVIPGAVFPLVRTQEETRLASQLIGKVMWLGAWGQGPTTLVQTPTGVVGVAPANPQIHGPWEVPPMPEGAPRTKPLDEDAAHFLIRQVHAHPHQVTIYAAGPLTNIALAVGQITNLQDVSFSAAAELSFRQEFVRGDTGKRVANPLVLIATSGGYRLRCKLLPRASQLEILLAIARVVDFPKPGQKTAISHAGVFDKSYALRINQSDGIGHWYGHGAEAHGNRIEDVYQPQRVIPKTVKIEGRYTVGEEEKNISKQLQAKDFVADFLRSGVVKP